jgi:serine phosphatase RsbU (regulator of sigma subunit)
VVEASLMVNSTLDLRVLAENIIGIATRLIGSERGSLFLVDRERGTLTSLVAQGVVGPALELRVGDGIVGSVAASGEAVILNQPYDDPRFDPSVDRVTGYRTRSLLTVPVRDRDGELVAVLQLLNNRGGGFTEADVAFLAELGVPFAIGLTTAGMHREIVERERMREELRLAAEIQRTLQPADGCSLPGLCLKTLVRPCLEVGGDYWDLIPSPDESTWWLVMADISGKGVAAGLIASNVQAYLWSRRGDDKTLDRVVREGNDLLYRLTRGRKFATMVVVEWTASTRRLRWVSAGHPPVLVRHRGRVRCLGATGRPIGLLPDQAYTSGDTELEPGDVVVAYTDGVIEAGIGSRSEEFGLERLVRCVAGEGDIDAVLGRIEDALHEHLDNGPLDDDLTVLCAQCEGG